MRLAVVSPFLDRQHGTELCVIEQIEHLANKHHWRIDLYSQRVEQVEGVKPASDANAVSGIFWHRISDIPGPHLLKYLWWFWANQRRRRNDRRSGSAHPELLYSPGINCLDADVIVVHIVFHAFYDRVRSELTLSRSRIGTWPLLIHRNLYYKLIMFLERRIYSDARSRLIAVSNLVAAELKRYFQRDDVTVIRNAVNTSRFNPAIRASKRSDARRALGYSDDQFVVLLIGNDWKKKGLGTLLQGAALLKDESLKILVVGNDNPGMYRLQLAQLGLQNRVRFEKISKDVLTFYAAADVYAGPSLEDAFNLPILEAMACGLPVIASAEAGASELIIDGKTGFILRDPMDHTQLAEWIERLIADENLRRSMGNAAVRDVQANSSWERNTEQTREFLEAVVASRRK